ncbi:MAG TPA: EamA/RhaT family transporter, partial [Pseudomonas sp.]
QIVFAGLWGFIVFNHSPSLTAQAGIAIICLSGLAAAWQQRKKGG